MSGSSYTEVFSGNTVKPSDPSYAAITMSSDVTLVWPLESTAGAPVVASALDVTATTGGLSLIMPTGSTGSTGVVSIITNVGASSFTVERSDGTSIATIATTQSWLLLLTSNATTAGTWRALQLASTTSSATAASLAGQGLEANGSLLQVDAPTSYLSASTSLTPSYRGEAVVWTGATGTLQLNTIATLGDGWYCFVANDGSAALTISTSSGQTINGDSTLVMNPGNSGIIVCGASGFASYGALIGALAVINGGTGATTAPGARTNLGATSIGSSIFTAPNAAAVVALLGLNDITWIESTVSTNQVLSASSNRTIFVCTAALSITLPLTTTLETDFAIQIYARTGVTTVTPQITDSINGASAGISFTIPARGCAQFVTDAAGKWWVIFGPEMSATTINTTGTVTVGTHLTATNITASGTLGVTGAATAASMTTTGTLEAGTSLKVGTSAVFGGAVSGITSLAMTGALTGATTGAFSGNVTAAKGDSGSEVVIFSQFAQSTPGASGYVTLPSAGVTSWRMQCGTDTTSGAGTKTVNFSPVFASSPLVVVTRQGTLDSISLSAVVPDGMAFGVYASDETGTGVAVDFSWIAVGAS